MRDISTSEATSTDIFRLILDYGPLTLYTANQKASLALGTIHRHFKQLHDTGKIIVYKSSGKRKKISYGPTVFGFVYFYDDKKVKEKLENYFLLWADKDEFLDNLNSEGFDIEKISENPQEYKKTFVNYVRFFNAVEKKIEAITTGDSDVPRDILMFVSSALLIKDPTYQKLWEYLYINLPSFRHGLDNYVNNTVSSYNEFKKRVKSKIKN